MKPSAVSLPAEPVTPRSAQSIQRNIGYYVAVFSLGLIVASLGPTLPELARQTGSPLKEISTLFLTRSLGLILGALLAGRLFDRLKGHPLLVGGLFALAVLVALVPTVPLLWLMVILFLLQGLAASAISVGGNTLLVWANRGRTGPLVGGLHFIWGVGAFISPIIIARAVKLSGGISLAYWILAALALPACVWLARLQSPAHPHKSEFQRAGEVKVALAAMIWCFFFLYTGTEACFGNWIFTYALKTGLGNTTSAAYLNSAFWGALTLGRLLAIPIAMKLRPRSILTIDLCGCLVSVFIILLWQGSKTALWVGVFGTGLSMASVFPTTISFAQNRMPLSGKLTGIFFAGSSTGSMTLPWVVGQFFESVGPRMLLYMAFAGLTVEVGIFALMMLYPRRAEKELPKPDEEIESPTELTV
ncbi:MAG TPA: MFS transporter [Blastocatellia bacterium]|nr:MFS transporter [Blastocatellia bacterium]